MNEIVVDSPAKINWFLRLLYQRLDGYHQLQSAMQCIDLCDRICLTQIAEPVIEFATSSDLELSGLSSCERAASLLRQATHFSGGARIHLRKNIPLRSGLGGASSNAAAVLMGLNRLWGRGLTTVELSALGRRIGSDVAFFIEAGSAWVEGSGEQVCPWQGSEIPLLLYTHRQGFSTGSRYNHPRLPRSQTPLDRSAYSGQQVWDLIGLGNAFEDLSIQIDSSVAQILSLANQVGRAFMTGSGSTIVVALDPDISDIAAICEQAQAELRQQLPSREWTIIPARSCTRSALHDSINRCA